MKCLSLINTNIAASLVDESLVRVSLFVVFASNLKLHHFALCRYSKNTQVYDSASQKQKFNTGREKAQRFGGHMVSAPGVPTYCDEDCRLKTD